MKKQIQKGFTLIELMIVVAIIGILAAVAIPAYQDYIARSQVSEAVTLLGGAKTPVSEYIADRGEAPTGAVWTDVVNTTAGKYVASVTIAASSTATSVELTATMRTNGVNNAIAGSTLLLVTTDGGRVWTCTATTGSVAAKYRPAACRA